MERKVGEIFTYNNKLYQVVKGNGCIGCAFTNGCYTILYITGKCVGSCRLDNTSVVFKEVNNMEIKNTQLTIKIPQEMEVDIEKSNLTAGIITFRKKEICYADVLSTLANKDIDSADIKVPKMIAGKIIVLARLMTIAKYYK